MEELIEKWKTRIKDYEQAKNNKELTLFMRLTYEMKLQAFETCLLELGVLAKSSDELGNCNKPHVSGSASANPLDYLGSSKSDAFKNRHYR